MVTGLNLFLFFVARARTFFVIFTLIYDGALFALFSIPNYTTSTLPQVRGPGSGCMPSRVLGCSFARVHSSGAVFDRFDIQITYNGVVIVSNFLRFPASDTILVYQVVSDSTRMLRWSEGSGLIYELITIVM